MRPSDGIWRGAALLMDVVVALIVSKGKILVEHRRSDSAHSPGQYRFPAGHVEEGESLEGALKREVREELGMGVACCRKVHEAPFEGADGLGRRLHYFEVELDSEFKQGERLMWFSRQDRGKMSFPDDRRLIERLL